MSTIEQTITEVGESVTGFDEIAIVKAFGPLEDLAGSMDARALAFVHYLHAGQSHEEAKKSALSLTAKHLNHEFFADEEDEAFPDEPVTDQGKDEPQPEA